MAVTGSGGTGNGTAGGGGGGFGGANGGNAAGSGGDGASGDNSVYRASDGSGSIRAFFTEAQLRLINTSNAGTGADTIDGGPGSDELFGLGGPDEFIVDLGDHPDADSALTGFGTFLQATS